MIKFLHIINILLQIFIIYLFIGLVIDAFRNKQDLFGSPPINRFFFLIGKAATACRRISLWI